MGGTLIGCSNAAWSQMEVKQDKLDQYSYLGNCTDEYVTVSPALTADLEQSVKYIKATKNMSYAIMGMDGLYVVFLVCFMLSRRIKHSAHHSND